MNDFCVRAAGAAEIVRPRRSIGRFWAAPQMLAGKLILLFAIREV